MGINRENFSKHLLKYLHKYGAKCNEQDSCLVRIEFTSGNFIVAIEVNEFLATASTKAEIDEFHQLILKKYDIKRLGNQKGSLVVLTI